MKRKILLAMIVGVIALSNVWMAKVLTPAVQIPGSIAEEVNDFILSELPATESVKNTDLTEEGLVVAVIDGDTIDVQIQNTIKRVRYIGIDAPEQYLDSGEVECFAVEATKKNEALVLGETVRLEKDVSEVDRYDRLLRYVYVGEDFVNLRLVAEGYAQAVTYPPDITLSDVFKKAEAVARNTEIGFWLLCEK